MKPSPLLSLFLLVSLIASTSSPFEPQNTTPSSEKQGSAYIVKVTNLIAWEEIYKDGSHGLGDGTEESRDYIPYMNQTFIYWSNGSRTIGPAHFNPFGDTP